MPDPPVASILGDSSGIFNNAYGALQAKYTDAAAWADWAADLVNTNVTSIATAVDSFDISGLIAAAENAIAGIPTYTPGTITGYEPGEPPNTDIDYTSEKFEEQLLTTLQAQLAAKLTTYSTGLGDAETALFNREVQRQNDIRAAAYNELCNQMDDLGWDVPTGRLIAKQTQVNNESTMRLSDSSAAIMAESARLAVQFNLGIYQAATSVVGVLGQVYDSNEMRKFEKGKAQVMAAIERYKAEVTNNQVAAQMSIATEDTMAKSFDIGSKKATATAQLAVTAMQSAIEAAIRHFMTQVEAMKSVAQSAAQMVASALGSVNVSAAYGASGQASEYLDQNVNAGQTRKSESINYEGKV